MSRVAKNPVHVPAGLSVEINGAMIVLKNSNGSLGLQVPNLVNVAYLDNMIQVSSSNDSNDAGALAGTTRANINNMVIGLTDGFSRKLELVGVGYRAQVQGKILNLTLGFSHPVNYSIPDNIVVETPSQTEIIIKGRDKRLVGQVAADIRGYRPPEPYKGKGVRYSDEKIELKETKKK